MKVIFFYTFCQSGKEILTKNIILSPKKLVHPNLTYFIEKKIFYKTRSDNDYHQFSLSRWTTKIIFFIVFDFHSEWIFYYIFFLNKGLFYP
jgi:hypothetical protein